MRNNLTYAAFQSLPSEGSRRKIAQALWRDRKDLETVCPPKIGQAMKKFARSLVDGFVNTWFDERQQPVLGLSGGLETGDGSPKCRSHHPYRVCNFRDTRVLCRGFIAGFTGVIQLPRLGRCEQEACSYHYTTSMQLLSLSFFETLWHESPIQQHHRMDSYRDKSLLGWVGTFNYLVPCSRRKECDSYDLCTDSGISWYGCPVL